MEGFGLFFDVLIILLALGLAVALFCGAGLGIAGITAAQKIIIGLLLLIYANQQIEFLKDRL